MIEAWTIGISLVTRSNFGLVTKKMGAEAEAAQAKVQGVNGNLAKMPGVARAASLALDGLAIVAGATFVAGIKGASDMQSAIAGIAVTTGQTTDAVAKQFTGMALAISNATGVLSMADSMKVIQTMSPFVPNTARLHDQAFMTEIAKFADIQKLRIDHPTDILESTADLGRVAHMLGAYSTKDMVPVAEKLSKMSLLTPDSLSKTVTQLGYFAESYNRAGMSHDAILNLALLGNLSLGHGKWGAGYNQVLKNLVHPTKPKAMSQVDLGIRANWRDDHLVPEAYDAQGNIDFVAVNKIINRHLKGVRNDKALNMLYGAFDVNAQRLIALTSADKNLKFYDAQQARMSHMTDIDHTQHTLVNTLPGQTQRLTTAFQSLATLIMTPLTNALTGFIGKLADATQGLANYMEAHPNQAKAVGVGVTALTGYLVWRVASFARLTTHVMTKGIGLWASEGGKEIDKFEKSMVKAFTNGIVNIATKTGSTIMTKFVIPVLAQVNKLGPIGQKITSFVLGLVTDIGTFGTSLEGLLGVLGKLVGAPLTALMMVLNPTTIRDAHSQTGGLGDEGDPLMRQRMAAAAARHNAYVRAHRPQQHAMVGHGQTVAVNFHYHAAPGDDASQRRHALEAHRKMANQVASVFDAAGRTLTRAAGSTIQSSRMSSFETQGAYS